MPFMQRLFLILIYPIALVYSAYCWLRGIDPNK